MRNLGALLLLLAWSAGAADWTYQSMDGIVTTCINSDPIHGRVFVGTLEGFHYQNIASGQWISRDWVGWIGREVHAITWHETLDQRVITGRVNAFFKGYIELSDDLGVSEQIVYTSSAGTVNGMARDPVDTDRYYACTWPDVVPGELVRSLDGGESWTPLSGIIHFAMTSIGVGADGTVFVGGDQRVTRSRDGGDSWEPASTGLPPGYGIYCVAPNPEIADHVLASNDLGLYETFDGGDSWEMISSASCSNIQWGWSWAIVPGSDGGQLVGATTWDNRVLVSQNCGVDWSDESGNLATMVPVDLTFSEFDETLYVNTANHGVWSTPVPDPSATSWPESRSTPRLLWTSPLRPGSEISFVISQGGRVTFDVFDVSGRYLARLLDRQVAAGHNSFTWPHTSWSSRHGPIWCRLRTPEGARCGKLLVVP
jgi:hypothetical protein